MNLLVVLDTYVYESVGNCLVVKNGGRYHAFLAQMEYLGETGWNRRRLGGTSNRRHEIDTIPSMHANSQTLTCSCVPLYVTFNF